MSYLPLCRRGAKATRRRHRAFFVFLLACSVLVRFAGAQTLTPGSALGDAAAARAQARRFVAGRVEAAASGSVGSVPKAGAAAALVGAKAVHAAMVQPRSAAVASLSAAWTPLGPYTVASSLYGAVTGRITSVAPDPNDASGNTVWLGTTGGGVWKSTNAAGNVGSVSFTPLTDTLPVFAPNAGSEVTPSLSIGAVSVQPVPNPVVLAGTGDPNDATDSYYGEGILRTADGGQTWSFVDASQDGVNGSHHFSGLATSGFAWSTTSPALVVAAMATSFEAGTVGAQANSTVPGLYFSSDAGLTWRMATVLDGGQTVQAPASTGTAFVGNSATAVIWVAQRRMFVAAIQFHGYYSSSDGQNWTRLAHQPGAGLTAANCPVGIQGQGSTTCPMLRGSLAVQPSTGDMYALTIDINENDQGLWQDLCAAGSNGQCSTAAPVFANRIDGGALEVGQGAANSSTQIAQGSYDLSLAAVPGPGGSTLLYAGTVDLYRCSLGAGAASCSFRNTTNAGNGCNASSAVAPAQHALAGLALGTGGPLLFVGNDGGLWRSTDGVAQTGAACAATDASHFQNLNSAIGAGGSLAEVVGFSQDPIATGTLIAGLGGLGTAATSTASAETAWTQLSGGEGGFPQIDPTNPLNWYVSIGAGVNLKGCFTGGSCAASDFSGSADIGAVQTDYDAAVIDAPNLLDPQLSTSMLTGTCRVWRGVAKGGASWTAYNAISPPLDGGASPCTANSALIRSIAAGGPAFTSGASGNQGSEVIYAGMAGTSDGGGSVPGHLFVTKAANTASASKPWVDITGSPVQNNTLAFNSAGFDLSSVTVDPHDSTGATVYATIMGFGEVPRVYRSTDFGAHWTDLHSNLPDAPANSLVVDPNDANTVYIALDTGVYATQAVATCATENCWSVLGTALPNAPVTQLQAGAGLATGDGRVGVLRASTYGRGLWQTPLLTAHTSLQPELTASPAQITFLAQPVGTQSDALSVTLRSFGNAPASITSITVSGDFAETDTCSGQSVPAGQNCVVSVRFAPTTIGARSGVLTVYANVPGGQITVPLSGTATAAAAVVLTPLQVRFGATLVMQTAAAQIVTVSNTGGTPATLQPASITGDFAITSNTCGSSLPSQTGCSIVVTFTPTASGTRTGVLTVVDSAGTQTAQLSGTGQSPATDTLNPLALSFAQQQTGTTSAAQQVLLTNAGDTPLTLINAVIIGTDFVATNSCGATLAAHSACAISVSFVPTATGTRSATLQVTDQFRTQTVSLTGAGIAPAGVSVSPSVVSFGSTGVKLTSAPVTVVLTNNGGTTLLISSRTVSGDFSVASTTCGAALQPGTACSIALAFTPTQAGSRTGSFTLSDNAVPATEIVSLSGTGIDFSLAADGPVAQTVASGSTATFPLELSSVTGISGAVTFGCTGAPSTAVCTVNPSPAQLGGSVPIAVTLQTGLSATGKLRQPGRPGESRGTLFCFLAIPVACFGLRRRRGQSARLRRDVLRCAALLAVAAIGITGCGSTRLIPLQGTGGTGGTGGGGGTAEVTPPGTYPLTVTGSSNGITHSVSLTLVVQ